jgi:hypothetical protein
LNGPITADHAERVVAQLLVGRPGDRALRRSVGRQIAARDVEAREQGLDLWTLASLRILPVSSTMASASSPGGRRSRP